MLYVCIGISRSLSRKISRRSFRKRIWPIGIRRLWILQSLSILSAQTFYWPGGEMVTWTSCLWIQQSIPDRLATSYSRMVIRMEKSLRKRIHSLLDSTIHFDEEAWRLHLLSRGKLHGYLGLSVYQLWFVGWQFRDVKWLSHERIFSSRANLLCGIWSTRQIQTHSLVCMCSMARYFHGNCPPDMSCTPEYVARVNPYEDGDYFVGGGTGETEHTIRLRHFGAEDTTTLHLRSLPAMDHTA